jgi:carboxyl-terminal processing protease
MNGINDHDIPRPRPRRLRPVFLLAFCLVFGLGCGMLFDRWMLMAYVPSDASADFRLMSEAWNTISRYYVDRSAVTPEALTYGAISGMVNALGDKGHSTFLSPTMVKELKASETGQLQGVGLHVEMNTNGQVVILAPIDNSPAQRAGLRSGEIILSIDGRDIAGEPLNQVSHQISGAVGTQVELGILSPKTHRVRDVTIVRANIKLSNVAWTQIPGTEIADLRIAGFNDHVSADVHAALHEIQQKQMKGLILDLRNNPGGVLDEAVDVASEFLPGGNVLLVKDAHGTVTPVPVKPGGLATNMPMAVLVNRGSASASEIVAGALRDANRAELVGETTFGTGTVLNEFQLSGGSALLLAVDEWLTPSGESFWHKGLTPQIVVSLPQEVYPLSPIIIGEMTDEELQSSDDKQLLSALDWLEQQIKSNPI